MFILASQSPRRRELMFRDITHSFSVIVSDVDESVDPSLSPLEAVEVIAKRKGEKVFSMHPNDVVLSADTIVVIDNMIIGKPKDEQDAKRILRLLSGRMHEVITAYCIFYQDKVIENHVISHVFFNNLDKKLIDEYVASGSPMDKAGAYGAQDNNDFKLINKIDGSRNNVIGFPSEEILLDLKKEKLI